MLAGTNLSPRPDELTWTLERSGKFTVSSLYHKLCQGTARKHYSELWRVAIPLKIRVFLWQLVRKRLPTNGNIQQRHGPSNGRCTLCDEHEDTNHMFFICPMAKFLWSAVRELLGCSWNPSCFADLYRQLQQCEGQSKRVLWICGAALCWT